MLLKYNKDAYDKVQDLSPFGLPKLWEKYLVVKKNQKVFFLPEQNQTNFKFWVTILTGQHDTDEVFPDQWRYVMTNKAAIPVLSITHVQWTAALFLNPYHHPICWDCLIKNLGVHSTLQWINENASKSIWIINRHLKTPGFLESAA